MHVPGLPRRGAAGEAAPRPYTVARSIPGGAIGLTVMHDPVL
jgi:hypothetical protein